jgi:DNA-binding NarL/FixJ family response regulator
MLDGAGASQVDLGVNAARHRRVNPQRTMTMTKTNKTLRVLVAAPPGLYGDALCGLLGKLRPRIEIVRTHGDPDSEAVSADEFGLIVIDLDPYLEGSAEIVRACASRFAGVPLIAAASEFETDLVEAVLDSGAMGFLPKHYTEPLTLGVMHLVLEGASYRPYVRRRGGNPIEPRATDLQSEYGLTPRQVDVLQLMTQGMPNATIAKRLGITEGTTRLHVSAILRALNVQNRSEAVVVALRSGNVNLHQVRNADGGKLDLGWLLPHMKDEQLKQGAVIFRKGEPGTALYYLQRGNIVLTEFNMRMGPGSLFGEIGIFAPGHTRTATAVCESDVHLLTLTAEKVKEIYALNPQFAFYVVHLIAGRLMADQARLV